ncbi:dnaJ homolog subfamily C member 22 [Hydra vulgaris]|uniref:DnaJ homolog subfamily C member 22 n=1 Tax=Hydra vulgaris TaxID=6087 RepID=A0ABM4CVK9_HYDVU
MGNKKSLCVTYFLWLFFGWFGVHHFYLGRDMQAFLWWSTLGGFFTLGWIRDLWRIPEYVDDANEDPLYMDKLGKRMRFKDYPKFNVVRFSGELLVGYFYGFLIRLALPTETPVIISMVLICIGITVGVHLVGNIGRDEGGLIKPFCATFCCYYILFQLSDSESGNTPNFMYCSLAATVTFNYYRKYRRVYKRQVFCHRIAILLVYMALFSSLWLSFLYFNAEITTEKGEKVKFKDSVIHFFKSPAWLEFSQTLKVIYEEGKKNGWKNLYDEFVKALDPKGETNAYKVLGLSNPSTESEIKKAYKTLVRQWHPDRFHDPEQRLAAQKQFMEVQSAYELLTNKKKSNTLDDADRTNY